MTTHFPQEIFKNILSYCDDTIERKQRQLWKTITPFRSSSSNGSKITNIKIGFMKDEPFDDKICLIEYDLWELTPYWGEEERGCLKEILADDETWTCLADEENQR